MGEFLSPQSNDKEAEIEKDDSETLGCENNLSVPKDLSIVVLPAITDDTSSDIFRRVSEGDLKNFHKLEKFIDFIKKIDRSRIWYCVDQVDYLIETFEVYKNRFEKIDQSRNSKDLVGEKIRNSVNLINDTMLTGQDVYERFKDHLEQNQKDTIALADSHSATYYDLKAARELSKDPSSDSVVFVFDNHRDVFTHGDNHVWKGNVFRKLVQEKLISGAAFFQDFNEPGYVYNDAKAEDATPLIKTFNNYEKSSVKLNTIIEQSVKYFAQRGASNAVFSIDIDALRAKEMGYTAMEYTPLNFLGFLASKVNTDALPEDPSQLSDSEINEFMYSLFHLNSADRPNYLVHTDKEREVTDPPGVHLSELGLAIERLFAECNKYGIRVGIDLKSGGRYFGDIVELNGFDYGERTTKATSALINRINTLTKKQKSQELKEKQEDAA